MKCQKCNQRTANTHITQVINGTKTEMYLCSDCANENQELFSFKSAFDNEFENIFSSFWGTHPGSKAISSSPSTKKCDNCGLTLAELMNHGKPGCSKCYTIFAEQLTRPLKQIHGSARHTGKIPENASKELRLAQKIKSLESKLNIAIGEQNFEDAAIIRDQIKALRNENRQEGI